MESERQNQSTDSTDTQEAKRQLIDEAVEKINLIQMAGQALRTEIGVAKDAIIAEIQAQGELDRQSDALCAVKRANLIKQMGDAAKAGDLTELKRIKELLSLECK